MKPFMQTASSASEADRAGAQEMTVPWQMPPVPDRSQELQAEMDRLEIEEVRQRDLQKQRELEQLRDLARFD